jgi:membrane associated rhomboid family serine protease
MNNVFSFSETPASIVILIITVAISLYSLFKNHVLLRKLMLHPYSLVHDGKWYQILTSGFVHADMPHLMFNMLSFYFFAFKLESLLGVLPFLLIYFSSMVLADLSTIFKNRDNPGYYSLGASGAVAGVIFSSILFFPESKIAILIIPIGIPAPIFGILYLAYCYYAAKKSHDMINHEAHFWGALTGILVSILLNPDVVAYFFNSIF